MKIDRNIKTFAIRDFTHNRSELFNNVDTDGMVVISTYNEPKYLLMSLGFVEEYTTLEDYLRAIMKKQGITENETLDFLQNYKRQIDKAINEFKEKYSLEDNQEKLNLGSAGKQPNPDAEAN